MHVLTPAFERAPGERDLLVMAKSALEEHWAVAAVATDRRSLLLERADAAAVVAGDGLGEPIADSLALLGTAYELAALSQLDTALHPAPSAERDLANAVLMLGAARAFRCAAALRPPLDDGEAAVKWALRLGALATVSRQTEAYGQWWQQRTGVADAVVAYADALDGAPWETYARGSLWLAWLGLLGAPLQAPLVSGDEALTVTGNVSPAAPVSVAQIRLAALRERRAVKDGGDAGRRLNAAALRARMTEFAIRHLADATELLTVAVLRRTLPDVSSEFKLRLSAARSALAGDHGHDMLLAWLQAAGVTLAGGVSAQLELPGF